VLEDFWRDFSAAVTGTKDLSITQVIDALDAELGPHFFPVPADGRDPRLCPGCNAGRLSLKLGKFGAFIGCSDYPECRYTRPLAVENGNGENGEHVGPRELGLDPAGNLPVSLRKGPYGFYVQRGLGDEAGKPKRVSLPKGFSPAEVTLEQALSLLSLPRTIGTHPEDGKTITASIGRFGPYIKHGDVFRSLKAEDDVLSVGINRAVSLLAEPRKGGGRRMPTPLRVVGNHPGDGAPVNLFSGRYGPYVSHGGVNATIPRDIEPEAVTLEQALELLGARSKDKGKRPAKTAKPAAPAAKSTKKKGQTSRAKAAARKKGPAKQTPEAAE
jgi:DNA topoisomerase-1